MFPTLEVPAFRMRMAFKFRPSKKLFTLLAAAFLAVLLAANFLPGLLVDPAKYREMAVAQVKALTGRALSVKGETTFSVFPSPTLTLSNIELEPGTDPAKPIPRLRAGSLMVQISFSSLFSATPDVQNVTLLQPVLEIERASDGEIYWDWLHAPENPPALPMAMDIRGGKVIYFNPYNEKTLRAEDIHLRLSHGAQQGAAAAGQFTYLGKQVRLDAALPPLQSAGQAAKLELKLWQSETTMLQASLERVSADGGSGFRWRGEVQAEVEDANQWLPAEEKEGGMNAPTLTAQGTPVAKTPEAPPPAYPIKLSGQLSYADNKLDAVDVKLETEDSSATGSGGVVFADTPEIEVNLSFSRLSLRPHALTRYFGSTAGSEELSPVAAAESEPRLPQHIRLTFEISAESLFLDSTPFSGVTLNGSLKDGEFLIDALEGTYADNTAVGLSGKIVDTAKGMRFQGKTKTSGDDVRALLATFDPAAERLPEKAFGAYYMEANVFISSEQLRLSEAELKLGELDLSGGLVTYFEDQPRIEAEIALRDTDLDYFRDTWREEVAQNDEHMFVFRINGNVDFTWLKSLKPIVDLKVNLERFTFLEKTGDTASFRLYARPNEFGVHNIAMRYPTGTLKGDIKVTVGNAVPHLELNMEIPELDTAYFSDDGEPFGEPWMDAENPESRWSGALFDFGWMIGLTADVNLAIRRVIHRDENYDRFWLQGTLAEEQMQISKLTFERFGGKLDMTGTLTGGKVPGFSSNYTLYNADVRQLLQSVSRTLDKVTGRVSLSGSAVTSGINFQEWVKQADAKVVVAGRGVRAEGFNLQGAVDAVLAARSVADVVTNVDKALPNGSTDFSVDGNINISRGIIRTPGITLTAGHNVGALTGEVLIIPWKMALNMVYQLKTLQSETVPTLTVDLSGTPDQYVMRIDTSSLEAFVAKRVVGR